MRIHERRVAWLVSPDDIIPVAADRGIVVSNLSISHQTGIVVAPNINRIAGFMRPVLAAGDGVNWMQPGRIRNQQIALTKPRLVQHGEKLSDLIVVAVGKSMNYAISAIRNVKWLIPDRGGVVGSNDGSPLLIRVVKRVAQPLINRPRFSVVHQIGDRGGDRAAVENSGAV